MTFHIEGKWVTECQITLPTYPEDDYGENFEVEQTGEDEFDCSFEVETNGEVTVYTSYYEPSESVYFPDRIDVELDIEKDIKKIFGENVVIHDMESYFEEG